jgi:acetyl esterase/lipase
VIAHLKEVGKLFTSVDAATKPYVTMRLAMDRLFFGELPGPIMFDTAALPGMDAEWVRGSNCIEEQRLLLLHGGGYIAGGIASHRLMAGWLAESAQCAVLLVNYRLAPEHPFPAAVDDAVSAYRWMAENGPSGPAAARRRFVAGDSAGGGLSLVLLLKVRELGIDPCHGAVTFSAWTDVSNSSASMLRNQNVELGAVKSVCDYFTSLYMNGADPFQSLASPVYGDLQGLPPLLLQVSDSELVFDDSVRFAEAMSAAGQFLRSL